MCQNVRMISRRTFGALLLGAVAATATGCTATAATETDSKRAELLDAAEFTDLISDPEVVVIDVRTPAEYQEGHLRDALLIDIGSQDFADKVSQLDPDKTYALYCRSANRSGQAVSYMRKAGFKHVHHLRGGIGAWQASGGEVVTG